MKKIVLFSSFILGSAGLFGGECAANRIGFNGYLTSGYVFKQDSHFKDVYGQGIVNILTADGFYSSCNIWGIGAKLSYWRAKGKTTFLQYSTILQQVPATVYVRAAKNFDCGLGIYGALGGGAIWLKEHSYLGDVHATKGIAEVEAGLNYRVWRWFNITGAFRYLFPPQSQSGTRADVGGIDLRAGIGCSF